MNEELLPIGAIKFCIGCKAEGTRCLIRIDEVADHKSLKGNYIYNCTVLANASGAETLTYQKRWSCVTAKEYTEEPTTEELLTI